MVEIQTMISLRSQIRRVSIHHITFFVLVFPVIHRGEDYIKVLVVYLVKAVLSFKVLK